MQQERFPGWHGTTIVAVRKGGKVVIAGDGQVSLGQTVIKGSARKVRRLEPGGKPVLCGFAGSTADAFTLLERLEKKLEAAPGQLARASDSLMTATWGASGPSDSLNRRPATRGMFIAVKYPALATRNSASPTRHASFPSAITSSKVCTRSALVTFMKRPFE